MHIFLSKGERQSKLLMDKVADHVKVCGIVAETVESTFMEATQVKQLEVRFPNGSVIYGLPANPDTARGYTGDVTLDEFAFHAESQKIFTALYPTITRGYGMEVISTPNGQAGKYFELAKAAGLVEGYNRQAGNRWSAHRVTIHDAVAQGLPVDLELLREGSEDEETWQQEYECIFLSDAANYIPMELIIACQSEAAGMFLAPEWKPTGNLYMGVDIGRKRDLTVAWLFEHLGDVLWSRAMVVMRGQTFDVQERAICDLMDLGVRRACVDQSGLGMMLAERLVEKYGSRVEPVTFTAKVKEDLAPRVKAKFEERLVRIPDNREIRTDVNAVKRFVTAAGNVRFDADRTERGHADRFWALALAIEACGGLPISVELRRGLGIPAATQARSGFGMGGAAAARGF